MRRFSIACFYVPVRLHRIPNRHYVFDKDIRRERIRSIFERPMPPAKWNLDRESRKREVARQLAEWDDGKETL